MSMTHQEAGRLSRSSQLAAKIAAYCEPYRPKLEYEYYDEKIGRMVPHYSAGYADGSASLNRVR